jgi:hypothetical protein
MFQNQTNFVFIEMCSFLGVKPTSMQALLHF